MQRKFYFFMFSFQNNSCIQSELNIDYKSDKVLAQQQREEMRYDILPITSKQMCKIKSVAVTIIYSGNNVSPNYLVYKDNKCNKKWDENPCITILHIHLYILDSILYKLNAINFVFTPGKCMKFFIK